MGTSIFNCNDLKFNFMRYIIFIISAVTILSCKKEKGEEIIPYKRVTIYDESFNDDQSWKSLPENTPYIVGSECVRVQNQMLKLSFDQTIPNCGCAWVGAKKSITNLQDLPTDKLGVRIKLNNGFFQYMVRYTNSIDPLGNPSTQGSVISQSYFRFNSPGIQMQIANSFNAWFHEDSIVSEDFNKIEGIEFEMIYNKGEKILFIDGLKVDNKLVNISNATITNQIGIDFQFTLGHQPEFSPRLDELYIEELEVFTWQGEYQK
jgi:hypothetical protein